MAIPDFQRVMLPLLQHLVDGREHHMRDAIKVLAIEFALSTAEQEQLLPSRRQATFDNRVHWAATYLGKAGLLARTGRGRVAITDRGRSAIERGLSGTPINMSYLSQFPEYIAFRSRPDALREKPAASRSAALQSSSETTKATNEETAEATPDEALEASYLALRRTLATDLLDRLKQVPPVFFERLVIDLLVAMGYGGSRSDAAEAVGGTGDGGIDGVIKEDPLGLDSVYIQAKRWQNPVGPSTAREFAGSLEEQRASKGVLITTSSFTRDARVYVGRIGKRIILIDGERLADLMIDYGVGVVDGATYTVKRIDADYFGEA